eukprot:scaffold5.g914.t1
MSGLGNEAVHGHNPTNHATLADAVVESVSSALGRGAEARLPAQGARAPQPPPPQRGAPRHPLGSRAPRARCPMIRRAGALGTGVAGASPAGEVHGVYGTGGLAGRDAFAGGVEGEIAPVHGASSAHEALSDQGIPVTESD